MALNPPFTPFVHENDKGDTLHIAGDLDPYPLKDLEFPLDHGHMTEYYGEDGQHLELFVGSEDDGYMGYVVVFSPFNPAHHETLMYTNCSRAEVIELLTELDPITNHQGRFNSADEAEAYLDNFIPKPDPTTQFPMPPDTQSKLGKKLAGFSIGTME